MDAKLEDDFSAVVPDPVGNNPVREIQNARNETGSLSS